MMLETRVPGPPRGNPASEASSILIVDDERLIRWSLRERLAQAGYRVVLAGNGAEARDHFEEDLALVLLDLRLPDVDGLALVREFRAQHPDCPVVLMTAYGSPELEEEAERQGVIQVVDKPFRLDDIAVLAERLLKPSRPDATR